MNEQLDDVPDVAKIEVVAPYVLALTFADGTRRVVDLEPELDNGPIFKPLKDFSYFARARIRNGTAAWPNGADFAPEFLYYDAKAPAQSRRT